MDSVQRLGEMMGFDQRHDEAGSVLGFGEIFVG